MGDAQRRAAFINSIIRQRDFAASANFASADLEALETRLDRLEEAWRSFNEEHLAIIESTVPADKEAVKLNETVMITTEDNYLLIKATFCRKLNELNRQMQRDQPANAQNNVNSNNGAAAAAAIPTALAAVPARLCTGLQLQAQDIPDFSGAYAEWPEFRDTFVPLVHNDANLLPTAKLNTLKRHLKGKALDVIAGITVNDANYETAWELVCSTFEDKRLITQSLLKIIRQLRPLTGHNPAGLRFIIIKFRQVTRQLVNNGSNLEAMDASLQFDLMELLDPNTKASLEAKHMKRQQAGEAQLKLAEILDWLDTKARSELRSRGSPAQPNNRNPNDRAWHHRVKGERSSSSGRFNVNHAQLDKKQLCPMCKQQHQLDQCENFLRLNPYPRSQRIKSFGVCFNCFSPEHSVNECTLGPCQLCNSNKRHHRLLCFVYCDQQRQTKSLVGHVGAFQPDSFEETVKKLMRPHEKEFNVQDMGERPRDVLLATALVNVQSAFGISLTARALCDNGSQANIISEDFLQKLKLQRKATFTEINPIGDNGGIRTRGIVRLNISPQWTHNANYSLVIHALVMKRIAAILPDAPAEIGDWPPLVTRNLADPTLCEPSRIDLLLGAHVWTQIICGDIIRQPTNDLIAQKTQFGWLVYGGLRAHTKPLVGELQIDSRAMQQLNVNLQRLFELESVRELHHRSKEEELCEQIFVTKHHRNSDGRYVVPIPLDVNSMDLGDSYRTAHRRYVKLEERFKREPKYFKKYSEFMTDYIEQGHMSLLEKPIERTEPHYFIPHHGIYSEKTDKFRAVFDASAVTSSGKSLNDIQMLGERLQDNLADIILRFRVPRIALTADIRQMYRQILVDEAYRNYMLILWRPPGEQKIREYRLNTVTYGLKHSPHTAVRTLHQCAEDGKKKYPLAAAIVKKHFYMDDLSTGADNPAETITIYRQMKALLSAGGFDLRKWTTNDVSVQRAIGGAASSNNPIEFATEDVHSVLGVVWSPRNDKIQFNIKEPTTFKLLTKRVITSEVAKLFDPTGLLAPYVVTGKILIRELWLSKFGWDDRVHGVLLDKWKSFYSTIEQLSNVKVPRWIGAFDHTKIELHGFADASESAYCAVIYYRIKQPNNSVRCGILASRTKVAPIKTISIPRLELSGALLLSRLSTTVQTALKSRVAGVTYWLDSTIALAWIAQEPHSLKTFVANRVSEIQTTTKGCEWKHIRSADNPADLGSRGADAPELVASKLWWSGPPWLSNNPESWPGLNMQLSETAQLAFEGEQKSPMVAATTVNEFWIADRYSDFSKLCLVTAYILRFVKNVRFAASKRKLGKPIARQLKEINEVPPLRRIEWLEGETFWFKKIQQVAFAKEITLLSTRSQVTLPKSSVLAGLSPFLDEEGVIRVGGRLTNAPIPYEQRHPTVLPGDSALVRRLIYHRHLQLYHGGIHVTTQLMRDRFWIVGGRNVIRSVIHRCIECFRQRKLSANQQMVPLVPSRVTTARPFSHVSLDYCGPFEVKRSPGRCKTMVKIYVAVFICMATRAIHLQIVENLSTAAFIDAYQQMAARRGHCLSITSDNAKCFVGAKRKFDEVLKVFEQSSTHRMFATRGIEWKFIMPRSPSQGGSHEAAVKLFKHHLKRCTKEASLSVTEFSSLSTRIEGCLNSRPLVTLRDDATDDLVLTPAHFLIHGPYENAAVEGPESSESMSLGNRWRRLKMLHIHFWRRWRQDYLNSIINRNKWKSVEPNVAVGDVVLMQMDNVPPNQWPIGIIVGTHPGADGLVRNVTIKHNGKTFQRAVQRLCRLPIEHVNNRVVCRQDVTANV